MTNQQNLLPQPPNDEGATMCTVRWMVETPAGWLGAWDKGAFQAYVDAAVTAERERCAKLCELLAWEWEHAAGHPTEALNSAAAEIRGAAGAA